MICDPHPWRPIQAMDDESFAGQLMRHDPALRRYAARLSASAADAEDLVQDTCLKCWRARHRFAAGTNFMAWARTIMRNTFFTSVRRRRYEIDVADDIVEHVQTIAPAQQIALELKDALSALAHLDGGYRRAVIMASEGVSVEEGAAALEIPVNTYKSRVRRGRMRLGRLLDGKERPAQGAVSGSRAKSAPAARIKFPDKRNGIGITIG